MTCPSSGGSFLPGSRGFWALRGRPEGGRIPVPGQLPTQTGRLWAGRKQPPEVRGTRQTRVPGNDPDLGLSSRPALCPWLPAACLTFPVLQLREYRRLGWSQGMTLDGGGTREREVPEAQDSSARLSPRPRSQEKRHRARFQGSCAFGFRRAFTGPDTGTYSINRDGLGGEASMRSKVSGRGTENTRPCATR